METFVVTRRGQRERERGRVGETEIREGGEGTKILCSIVIKRKRSLA